MTFTALRSGIENVKMKLPQNSRNNFHYCRCNEVWLEIFGINMMENDPFVRLRHFWSHRVTTLWFVGMLKKSGLFICARFDIIKL